MSKIYKVIELTTSIEEYEIVKRTPKQIVYLLPISKERTDKVKVNINHVSWNDLFDTPEEANQELIDRLTNYKEVYLKRIKLIDENIKDLLSKRK